MISLRRMRPVILAVRTWMAAAGAAIFLIAASSTAANAITVSQTCTGAQATTVSIEAPAFAATCFAGSGNINGKTSGGNSKSWDSLMKGYGTSSGYKVLGVSDSDEHGVYKSDVFVAGPGKVGTSSLPGAFSILADVLNSYHALIVAFKQGNGWAAFFLPDGVLEGAWYTSGGSLSHAVVYGLEGAAVVPIPAGLPLLGAGVALLGFMGWRKKRGSSVQSL
jgi:hypothetical protein